MIQKGIVADRLAGRVLVEICTPSQCQSCATGAGCGAGVFNQLWTLWAGSPRISASGPLSIAIGDPVELFISERWLLKVAVCGFFIPVVLTVVATVMAQAIAVWGGFFADSGALIGLVAGLASGIVFARFSLKRVFGEFTPVAIPVALNKANPTTEHRLHHIPRS